MNLYREQEEHWISVSDMMSGLMVIFLFIAVSYMIKVTLERDKIKQIAVTYSRLQESLYNDLLNEFKDDLDEWDAVINKPPVLSIRFESPEVLFEAGSDLLRPRFKNILDDFFPRYVKILTSDNYRNDIEEVRIEGHTSSDWINLPDDEAYFQNMRLSQDRTRSVLHYIMDIRASNNHNKWLRQHFTANGLSSSKLIIREGKEDKQASRRVEFRVKTNAEKRIVRIIQESES